jgi:hypothetical protein
LNVDCNRLAPRANASLQLQTPECWQQSLKCCVQSLEC